MEIGELIDQIFDFFKPEIEVVNLATIEFQSDHGELRDNSSDWKLSGTKYSDLGAQEWRRTPKRSFPISQTRNTKLALRIELNVQPRDAKNKSGRLLGDGGEPFLSFESSTTFKPGPMTISVTANEPLPDAVDRFLTTIAWQAELGGAVLAAGSSGPHTIFVTLAPPRNEGHPEDGATLKRMEAAVRLVSGLGTTDPHGIVAGLMAKIPYYTLQRDPNVPAQYRHPQYFNSEGGAWAIAEYMSSYAECQAIVRFVRGVLFQVGCPGVAKGVVIYARPERNQGLTALEGPLESDGGLNGTFKLVGTKRWYAALADRDPVAVGKTFTKSQMGMNNFEACLKFTDAGVTHYYGGGAGRYDTPQQVLRAFQALVWVSIVPQASGNIAYRIEEIVARRSQW